MEYILTFLVSFSGAIGLAFLKVFGGTVLEKLVAWISFKLLSKLSEKTTNSIDGELVKEAEVAYYGHTKFSTEEVETVHRARNAASNEHRCDVRVEPTLELGEHKEPKSGIGGKEHTAASANQSNGNGTSVSSKPK